MTQDRDQARRFLVAAPEGRDGELICGLLGDAGFSAQCVESLAEIRTFDSSLLLGLILTDEALAHGQFRVLSSVVESQPSWSDLPVILLTSGSLEPVSAAIATQARLVIRSLVLLDRPVRKELLLSAVQSAFSSRSKQLEVRDARILQMQADEALRKTEKLAVAGRLAATIVHEVNNPLEAIGNLLFLVDKSSTLEEAKSFSRTALTELRRVSEIVDHTLRFHRATSKAAPTDLADLTRSALNLFRGKMREHGITEEVVVSRTLANCSPGEIRQAVVNLMGNAIDAMPQGGRLGVRVAPVSSSGRHFARITIADTGSGISSEIRSRLFTQFFTTKGSQGTGIGLWLTRDMILRNGGKLRFRSRTGANSGTVFSIWLPKMAEPSVTTMDPPLTGGELKLQRRSAG